MRAVRVKKRKFYEVGVRLSRFELQLKEIRTIEKLVYHNAFNVKQFEKNVEK